MPDQLSTLYGDLLKGSYDCVDRVIMNAYFPMGQSGGGLRTCLRRIVDHPKTAVTAAPRAEAAA
jgi:hypothetical protein